MSKDVIHVGRIFERIVGNRFFWELTKLFSYQNPKTQKENAEVTDVLIWVNKLVLLIEVKTRENNNSPIEKWLENAIGKAQNQLISAYGRIKKNERIKLKNRFFQLFLNNKSIEKIIGIIILNFKEKSFIRPSDIKRNIYYKELPIHVFSWSDIKQMFDEINTVPDFAYYLNDRYIFIRSSDIPLSKEMDALAQYKMNLNRFPSQKIDFDTSDSWKVYKDKMSKKIEQRNCHNQYSIWIDKIEYAFCKKKKIFGSIPHGLLFAWELGMLDRRTRAYIGKRVAGVQIWFQNGNTSRKFSFQNPATGNWEVYYFSSDDRRKIVKQLEMLVKYKLMIEIKENSFKYGVYGFGFQVSTLWPHSIKNLIAAIVIGADNIKGSFSEEELKNAYKNFGGKENYEQITIEEFQNCD